MGNGGAETIQVTINLNDVTEKPKKPKAPTVQNIAGNSRAIYVTWPAPSNTGRPPIRSYDLRYREAPSGPWFNGPQDQTDTTAYITGLSPSTEYDVQVRATNADGDGPWSDDGSATTSAALPETCLMSQNGNVRIADGFSPREGRVEICAEDPENGGSYIWGKVCDDYWTDAEAGVVCRAQGYHDTERYGGRFLKSYFGPGTLPFLLDDLICDGNESSLLDCTVASGGLAGNVLGEHNCKAEEAVGVRCVTEAEHLQHANQIETDENNQSPMLSVADVTVYESPGTTLDFVVTLSGTPTGTVTVSYATQDGSATAHIDYAPKSGMVTFPLGTTSRTVQITVLDDLVDEHDVQPERMTLRLSSPVGAHILDGVAYGTIENSDPLPQAWLARFGRAAADQALEAISGRLTESGPRTSRVTVAGRRLNVSGDTSPTQAGAAALTPRDAGAPVWGTHGGPGVGGAVSGINRRQLLTGTSFQWALGEDDEADESAEGEAGVSAADEPGARWTAWGEGAATRFSGVEDTLSLQGDVATATLGIDREGERWMAGVAVAFSEGAGAFTALGDDMSGTRTGTAGGLLQTTLTTLYPYARYALNDRLSLWGALGYGRGELRLAEGRPAPSLRPTPDCGWARWAPAAWVLDARGYELAVRTDAMRVQMHSDAVSGLAGAVANTGRVRALLEGSRTFTLGENRALEPTLEFGLRHDSGDSETGSGVELGAGIRYTDACWACRWKPTPAPWWRTRTARTGSGARGRRCGWIRASRARGCSCRCRPPGARPTAAWIGFGARAACPATGSARRATPQATRATPSVRRVPPQTHRVMRQALRLRCGRFGLRCGRFGLRCGRACLRPGFTGIRSGTPGYPPTPGSIPVPASAPNWATAWMPSTAWAWAPTIPASSAPAAVSRAYALASAGSSGRSCSERGRRTQRVLAHGSRSRHQRSGVVALVGRRLRRFRQSPRFRMFPRKHS